MSIEKVSSLHDDIFVPESTKHLGEYSNYPERSDPSEHSVLERLEQFGISEKDIEERFGKRISELTEDEYSQALSEAIKLNYDVIVGSVFDQYMFPTPENPDDSVRWEKMMKLIKRFEGMDARFGVNLIKRKENFQESGNLVMGLEAGAHLIKGMGDVRKLADSGIKFFGFQYGKDTPLATNVGGLTTLGVESVRYLLDNDLIIDLAHASYKTRQDIIGIATDLDKGNLISYTHGCTEEDIMDSWKGRVGERALKQGEVSQIVKAGGIIGLGVSQPFFASTRKVAERIDEIAHTTGRIDNIAIGTDFGGVTPQWLNEIKNPADFKILADILGGEFKMSEADIQKVLRSNVKDWIKGAID